MPSRRRFLTTTLAPFAASYSAATFPRLFEAFSGYAGSPYEAARDETLWREVQQAFTVDRSLVNLNNGGVCPAPRDVQEAMKRHLDYSNEAPVYTMWEILEPQREGVRQRVARDFGCDTEEIAFTRNASESLQTCQLGIDLKPATKC